MKENSKKCDIMRFDQSNCLSDDLRPFINAQENYTWMRREPDPKGAQLTVEMPHEYSATWSGRYAEHAEQ